MKGEFGIVLRAPLKSGREEEYKTVQIKIGLSENGGKKNGQRVIIDG